MSAGQRAHWPQQQHLKSVRRIWPDKSSSVRVTRHTGETFRTFQSALLPLVAYSQDLVKRFSAPSASLHARSVARNLEAPLARLASCLVDLSAACDPFDRRPQRMPIGSYQSSASTRDGPGAVPTSTE